MKEMMGIAGYLKKIACSSKEEHHVTFILRKKMAETDGNLLLSWSNYDEAVNTAFKKYLSSKVSLFLF